MAKAAFVLAFVSMLGVGFLLLFGEAQDAEAAARAAAGAPAVRVGADEGAVAFDAAAWDARFEALERRLAALELGARSAPEPALAAETDDALRERVEELERLVGEGGPPEDWADVLLEREEELRRRRERGADTFEQPLEGWLAQGLDPASDESKKLQALRALRGQRMPDGTDARLPVLNELIQVAESSLDGETRADVWRQLSGVTDASLLSPLLHALTFDEYPKAREEAAETLADFLPHPSVEEALRTAAERDPDEDVREQARDALRDR